MRADQYEVSGAHLTFNLEEEGRALGELGFLRRTGIQYHWANNGYDTFDTFLMDLKQSRRNNIRKVRSLQTEEDMMSVLVAGRQCQKVWALCARRRGEAFSRKGCHSRD